MAPTLRRSGGSSSWRRRRGRASSDWLAGSGPSASSVAVSVIKRFVGGVIAAVCLSVSLWTSAAAQDAAAIAANQRAFEAGARAMLAGDYAGAVAIFELLAETTGAPRVRLELGRSLFLAGEYGR